MKIKKNDILSIEKYIHEALYNNQSGYYMQNNPFGKNGDYITAPNISILFSEMIAIWIISFWENLKCPKKFNLIELGAGNGEMMKKIIDTFDKFPLFKSCCKINIFEKSIYLKKIQKKKFKNKKVKWLKNLNEISNHPSIFVANEFLDSLPIRQFIKKNKKWFERNIEFLEINKPRFIDILCDIKKIEKKLDFKISNNQKFIEYSPLSLKYFKIISKKIRSNSGGILIIDYGCWDNKMKNTLKSIYKHKFNNVLKNFSKADITYNPNFKLLEKILKKSNLKINGKNNQQNFLINLGILKRAEIISKNLPFSKKADIYYRVKRLIDQNSMGKLFKVILATKKNVNFQTGFLN
jgi:NADH dehydrogenase [ubiquinone] 1 alpha subcomplex assembly factor 7